MRKRRKVKTSKRRNQARGLHVIVGLMAVAVLSAPARAEPGGNIYAARIRPLLADRCGACHGETKHKGELSLHTPEAIARGGEKGPVLVAGKPAQSEIVRRLRLPVDDDDHMPPKGKPQPSEEEIKTIEAWIAAGADFGAPSSAPATAPASSRVTDKPAPAEAAEDIGPADPAALAALREHLVHVEAVRQGSNRLHIGFAASARKITEADVLRLLKPVLPQVESLSLARCAVGDETARLLAGAPRLEHLDLRATRIDDAGVAALSHLPSLRVLVLAQTHLSDAAVQHLLAFPKLLRLYLWKSGLTASAVARLREQRSQLEIDTGDAREAVPREVEPPIKLTGDAPLPGSAAVQSQPAATAPSTTSRPATALQPINSKCPVSGEPVDPRYTIVYRDRVVGFCCPKCPGQFWADPAKFESKLPPPESQK